MSVIYTICPKPSSIIWGNRYIIPKSFDFISDAPNGTVEIVGVGDDVKLQYTPDANFNGSDSFSYTMKDAAGVTSTAVVSVDVGAVTDFYTPTNLVVNGSFENGGTSPSSWSPNQINYIHDWKAADGVDTLDLNAESGGGYVEQSLQTVVGVEYTVGFELSKNPGSGVDSGSGTGLETLRVSATGTSTTSEDYAFSLANTSENMMWAHHTFVFTATDTETMLRLASADATGGSDAWGPALDEVVVVSNQIISDFDKGTGIGGDVIDLSALLSSINASADPFGDDYLNFQQDGGDTLIQIDADGGGDDYLTVMTLENVLLTESDVANYDLF